MARVDLRERRQDLPRRDARPSPISTSRSRTASSWSSSGRPGAGRRPRCGWWPGSRRSPTASCAIGEHGRQRRRAAEARRRDGLPELRALPAHDRVRQHRLPAREPARAEARDPRAREQDGRAARADRAAQAPAAQPLRRAAAARGDGPRDRPPAAGLPDGRAAVEPRREAARADARRDHAPPGASSASRRST